MAGNFWQSSHCAQWVLDKVDLARERKGDLEVLTDDEYCKIMIFYSSFIQVLGEQLKLRQQVDSGFILLSMWVCSRNILPCYNPLPFYPCPPGDC